MKFIFLMILGSGDWLEAKIDDIWHGSNLDVDCPQGVALICSFCMCVSSCLVSLVPFHWRHETA